jgi:hypothetical protein
LKTVQIINHMAGRELLFRLPVSDRDLFHLVEEKVYRVVGTMRRLSDFGVRRRSKESRLDLHEASLQTRSYGGRSLRQAALPNRHQDRCGHPARRPLPLRSALSVQFRRPEAEHEHHLPLSQLLRERSPPRQNGA